MIINKVTLIIPNLGEDAIRRYGYDRNITFSHFLTHANLIFEVVWRWTLVCDVHFFRFFFLLRPKIDVRDVTCTKLKDQRVSTHPWRIFVVHGEEANTTLTLYNPYGHHQINNPMEGLCFLVLSNDWLNTPISLSRNQVYYGVSREPHRV
jgi:hypothetical protein